MRNLTYLTFISEADRFTIAYAVICLHHQKFVPLAENTYSLSYKDKVGEMLSETYLVTHSGTVVLLFLTNFD